MKLLRRLAPAIRLPDWEALDSDRRGPRAIVAAGSLLALALLLLAVHAYLSPPVTDDRSGELVVDDRSRKLFVLVVDALNPEVVDSGRLTFLDPLLEEGFRAEIEPCVDRLTIPCLRDAFTGVSSFGLFGAFDNLVSAQEVRSSNLFRDLRENGRRSAGIAHGELDQFAGWLDVSYTGPEELQAVAASIRGGFDLVVYHYIWLDLVTHRASFGSPAYDRALDRLNVIGTELLRNLPSDYAVAVVGDHGHDEIGRHIQGLDVPTVFLSTGRGIDASTVEERIPITSYRFLLGSSLGFLPPPQYEGADLADILAPGPLRDAAAERTYSARRLARGRMWMPLVAALLLPALALAVAPGGARGRYVGLAAAGAALLSGALYPQVIEILHYNLSLPDVSSHIPLAILVAGGAWLAIRRRYTVAAGLLGLAALGLPPTVYRYGLFLRLVELAFVAAALLLFAPAAVEAIRERRWRRLAGALGLLAGLWLLVSFLAPVNVMNFMILNFPALRLPPIGTVLYWLAWGALTAGMAVSLRRGLPLGALATLGASGPIGLAGGLPPVATALLSGLALVALFTPAAMPLFLLGAWLSPTWYSRPEAVGVVLTVVFVLAAAAIPSPASRLRRWTVAAIGAGMAYYGLAYTTGLRANGIDYQFALPWLPGRMAERYWWIIALALVAKVLLPAGLVTHLLGRDAARVRPAMEVAALARLAALSLFLAGFLITVGEPPRYRLLEICEDMIAWWLLLALFAAVPTPHRRPPPEPAA